MIEKGAPKVGPDLVVSPIDLSESGKLCTALLIVYNFILITVFVSVQTRTKQLEGKYMEVVSTMGIEKIVFVKEIQTKTQTNIVFDSPYLKNGAQYNYLQPCLSIIFLE